jgi:phage baseplate assembly protein gpV
MCQGGIWHVPDVGETVYVVFDHGRPEYPMWQGGWWGEGDTTEDMSIMKVVVCTPEGLKVVLDRSAQTIFLEQSPGNSVLLSDDKLTIAHNGTIEVTGDSVDIVSTGTTNLRGQGVVNVDALDEVNITSTGSIKVDAADTVEVSSTGELTVASAGTCVIQSDSPMEIKSAKSVNVTAPEIGLTGTLTVMGDTSITGKVSVVGDGNVRGKWLSTINNSAKHTHPIGPDPKDPLTKIALPGVL